MKYFYILIRSENLFDYSFHEYLYIENIHYILIFHPTDTFLVNDLGEGPIELYVYSNFLA